MLSRIFHSLPPLVFGLLLFAGTNALADNAPVRWESGDAVYLAGANIVVSENIDDDLRASGDSIVIGDDVMVDGNVWLAGRRIVVDGAVDGNLDVRGQSVLLNGPIEGDVSVWAVDLTLGPDASIDGNLVYYTQSEAEMASEVKIAGEVEAHFFSDGGEASERLAEDWREGWEGEQPGVRAVELTLPGVLVMALLAGAVALFAGGWSEKVSLSASSSPALALLYGLLWMFGLPVIGAFAAITVIGIPFALLLLLLYGIVFLIGMIMAIIIIGRFIMGFFQPKLGGEMSERLLAVLVGALVLWGGASAPLLGGFFWFASIALGIGAILIAGRVRYEAV